MAETNGYSQLAAGLKSAARDQHVPIYCGFELTGRCNFDCKMCYVHVMDHREAKKKELSTQQWKALMDQAYDAGMLFALLSGGECLLRQDFKELYLHLWNKGVRVSVNTNGSLLDAQMLDFFSKYRPEQIQISLYGSNDAVYRAVTGQAALEKVLAAIRALQEKKIPVVAAITPNRYLRDDFVNLLAFLRDNGIRYSVSPGLIEPREGLERENFALSPEEYARLERGAREALGKKLYSVTDDIPPCGGPGCQTRYGVECNAGKSNAFFCWDGAMTPCPSLPEIRADALQIGVAAAWAQIQEQMQKIVQPSKCEGCFYRKSCITCPAMRYDGLYSGRAREALCQRMQKTYAAGCIAPKT